MGTAYGSKVFTLRRALIYGAICEMLGSISIGNFVSETIRSGIVKPSSYENEPLVFMYGMFAALFGAMIWLFIASCVGIPIATTQCIIGGLIGFSLIHDHGKALDIKIIINIFISWVSSPLAGFIFSFFLIKLSQKFLLRPKKQEIRENRTKKLFPIFFSLTVGIMGLLIFGVVFESFKVKDWVVYTIYASIFVLCYLFARFLLVKSLLRKSLKNLDINPQLRDFKFQNVRKNPISDIENNQNNSLINITKSQNYESDDMESERLPDSKITKVSNSSKKNTMEKGTNTSSEDIQEKSEVGVNETIMKEIDEVDEFDDDSGGKNSDQPNRDNKNDINLQDLNTRLKDKNNKKFDDDDDDDDDENSFSIGEEQAQSEQLITGNTMLDDEVIDLTNDHTTQDQSKKTQRQQDILGVNLYQVELKKLGGSVIFLLFLQKVASFLLAFGHGGNNLANGVGPMSMILSIYNTKSTVAETQNHLWMMAAGGGLLGLGEILFGKRVLRTVGEKITLLTPISGYVAQFASSLVTILATVIGMPVSTTQILIGSVAGVGAANLGFKKGVNYKVLAKTGLLWIFTLPISAINALIISVILRAII
ncbi:phosphate transporter [Anaeramoeba flamelloides]|uniref:Phosphate transporter n=1 Tax=Anaeramoeba flamelloides TaxID=1746091 RepID=A0AAV7ZX46_9EUKA|nr:phosphate transporter [Anaeramoeba flamelloides]